MTNLPSILNYALTSIFALEQAFPQSGLGSTKKSIIMNGVETLVKATAIETATLAAQGSNVGTNTAISTISTAVSQFVDATVAALNKSKVFATSH
jgi:hypothetical protein